MGSVSIMMAAATAAEAEALPCSCADLGWQRRLLPRRELGKEADGWAVGLSRGWLCSRLPCLRLGAAHIQHSPHPCTLPPEPTDHYTECHTTHGVLEGPAIKLPTALLPHRPQGPPAVPDWQPDEPPTPLPLCGYWGRLRYLAGRPISPHNLLSVQATEGAYGTWLAADVVCHEVAHQWFGNLVTAPDWTQLTINEGVASFLEYKCIEAAFPGMPARPLFYRCGAMGWVGGCAAAAPAAQAAVRAACGWWACLLCGGVACCQY
jgi:hypothetical protein